MSYGQSYLLVKKLLSKWSKLRGGVREPETRKLTHLPGDGNRHPKHISSTGTAAINGLWADEFQINPEWEGWAARHWLAGGSTSLPVRMSHDQLLTPSRSEPRLCGAAVICHWFVRRGGSGSRRVQSHSVRRRCQLPPAKASKQGVLRESGERKAKPCATAGIQPPCAMAGAGLWLPALLLVAQQETPTTPSHCGTTV